MKTNYIFSLGGLLFFMILLCGFTNAQNEDERGNAAADSAMEAVVPNGYATTAGTASFTGPFSTTSRRYQLLINQNQLTSFVGGNITSINFRIPPSSTTAWPAAPLTISSYEIYLGESVPPANRSLTFADNRVGVQSMVRSGALDINAEAYPFGGNPNPFGPNIEFQTAYPYNGGHLLIEIVHQGYTGSTSRAVDAIGTTIPGYLSDFSALWSSNLSATTGSQGNFSVVKINGTNIIPVELTSFSSKVTGNSVALNWTTATETNNFGFEIERTKYNLQSSTSAWEKIAFVNGAGTTTIEQNYFYSDKNVSDGKYIYRLKQIDFDGAFAYSNQIEVFVGLPDEFALEQNYPNPFNPTTSIKYSLPVDGFVSLQIFNSIGEKIQSLVDAFQSAGNYSVNFDASALPSGIYFYRIKSGEFFAVKKMMLAK